MRTTKTKNGRFPLIMGIININRESFYEGSRCPDVRQVESRIEEMLGQGADIIDIGACSTRPGSSPVTARQEWEYLEAPLKFIAAHYGKNAPGKPAGIFSGGMRHSLSIDTFHSEIVKKAYDIVGEFTVNDISAGEDDPDMLRTVGELKLPYIAMHKRGTPDTMQQLCEYPDGVVDEVLRYFAQFDEKAGRYGIDDYILDPGFGFAKTVEQNYELLAGLPRLKESGHEILVGLSRKSMIWKPLGITPEEALCGTAALNLQALLLGGDILRVHDVKEGVQCRKLYEQISKFL